MSILWIEDDPGRKIKQFSKYVKSLKPTRSFPGNSKEESIAILQEIGIDVITDFDDIRKLILDDEITEETPCNRCSYIHKFFDKYDLIFCDVNLSDVQKKQIDASEYDLMEKKTGVPVKRKYEGEALFNISLRFLDPDARMKFAHKFYFFSAYDGLANVQARMKEIFTEEKEMEWSTEHCIDDNDKKEVFITSNFTHPNIHSSYFKDWRFDPSTEGYFLPHSDYIEDVKAYKNQNDKWEISYTDSSTHRNVILIQDKDFYAKENRPPKAEDRIFEAIMGIDKLKVQAEYSKYYDLIVIRDNEEDFTNIMVNFYKFSRGEIDAIDKNTYNSLFLQIRKILEELHTGIQEIVFPNDSTNDSFENRMQQRDNCFWSKTNKKCLGNDPKYYPATEINKADALSALSAKEKLWQKFHNRWVSIKNAPKSITKIRESCPLYVSDTIQWAFSCMISSYTVHAPQATYEKKEISEEILPAQIHMFNSLVSALLMLLDFYWVIAFGNNKEVILENMRRLTPYTMTINGDRARRSLV